MKKVLYFAALLLTTVFASCEKEEIGGTATQATAGQWYVTIDAVDENGKPIQGGEDYFGLGRFILLTYNTVENDPTVMWVDDLGQCNVGAMYEANYPSYCIKAKVSINQSSMTFKSNEAQNFGDGWRTFKAMPVTIDGKILKGAGHQNNGSVADSIIFFVSYKNDPWYPDDGYAKYKVSGIRYSGLEEND
ncbi:MAG: hypothetical protein II403_00960 [Prevotella sp.]|nr:hypothetical protein [Prevotella sp.]